MAHPGDSSQFALAPIWLTCTSREGIRGIFICGSVRAHLANAPVNNLRGNASHKVVWTSVVNDTVNRIIVIAVFQPEAPANRNDVYRGQTHKEKILCRVIHHHTEQKSDMTLACSTLTM